MDAVTKATAQAVAQEIKTAVTAVLAKHNLQEGSISIKYGDSFKFTVEGFAVELVNGVNMKSPDVIAYEKFGHVGFINEKSCVLFAKIGTEFTANGAKFKFAGIRARGKNRIIGVLATDSSSQFIFSDSIIPKLNEASHAVTK
jgi:hypothetical protein